MPSTPGEKIPPDVSSTVDQAASSIRQAAGGAEKNVRGLASKVKGGTDVDVNVVEEALDATGAGGSSPKEGYPNARPPPREEGFILDAHQRWALGYGIVLLAVAAVLSHLLVSLFTLPPGGTVRQSFLGAAIGDVPPWVVPWLKIAIVAALGMILNRIFVVGYRGFSQKDFDAESVVYHSALIVQAPFIVVSTFGLGAWILPAEMASLAPLEGVTPLLMGLSFFFGYYSDDVLEAVHRKLLTKMGRPVQPRKGLVLRLDGVDMPLPALAQKTVADALQIDEARLQQVVEAFRKEGFNYTHEVVSRCEQRHLQRIQKAVGVPTSALEGFVNLCDVLRGAANLPDALDAFANRITTGPDAAAWLKDHARTEDGKRVSGTLAGLLSH